jgi:putative addiction module antidote
MVVTYNDASAGPLDERFNICYNVRMVLKVTRIGNSLGMILPKDVVAQLKVEAGDQLFLTPSPDGFRITPYDPEFQKQMSVANEIMRERRDALRGLAK